MLRCFWLNNNEFIASLRRKLQSGAVKQTQNRFESTRPKLHLRSIVTFSSASRAQNASIRLRWSKHTGTCRARMDEMPFMTHLVAFCPFLRIQNSWCLRVPECQRGGKSAITVQVTIRGFEKAVKKQILSDRGHIIGSSSSQSLCLTSYAFSALSRVVRSEKSQEHFLQLW